MVRIEKARAERDANTPRGVKYGNLIVLTDVDAHDAKERDYFLKGLLSPNEMSVFYGEPGCGKSFFVLYLCRSIAQRREVLGRRVHGTNILFMALEGISGFEKRLKAEIKRHGVAEGFSYIAQGVNLFSDPKAVEHVIAAIQATQSGILTIDTMNRAMAGGSENDPADMGQFILNIDAIRAATGVHVIIIHHSGKDASRGMRGHSALLGAADVSVEISKDPDSKQRVAKVLKAKDDADGDKFAFYLDIEELGIDADGDPITTCVVREADSDDAKTSDKYPMTPTERQWSEVVREYFNRDGTTEMVKPERASAVAFPCATRGQIRGWVRSKGLIGVAESVAENKGLNSTDRATFNRMLNTLQRKNKLRVHDDWIWLV